MEVESFEDEGVAKLLNDWFVSIKVSTIFAVHSSNSNSLIFRFISVQYDQFGSILTAINTVSCYSNMLVWQVDREERPDVDKVNDWMVNFYETCIGY